MNQQLHILGSQFSTFVRSVQLCCEEKGIKYSLGMAFDNETIKLRSESLYRYHPFGKVPVLIHNGKHYFETIVICRYLDTVFDDPALLPEQASEKAEVEQWANCLSVYVDDIFIRRYLLEFMFPKGPDKTVSQSVINDIEPEVIKLIKLLDSELADNLFFGTAFFSIADAILIPMLDYLAKLPGVERLFKEQQYILPYLARMRQRQSGQVVLL